MHPIYTKTVAMLSLGFFWLSALLAIGESYFIQLPPTATVQRRPHFYIGMHGISAIQAQDSDIYLTTSPIDVNYQYYRCHAGKRVEVRRINATALREMPERAGYIDVFDAPGCSGNQRSFRHDDDLCKGYFPQTGIQVYATWRSFRLPAHATVDLDTRRCDGTTTKANRVITVTNGHNVSQCFDRYSITHQTVYNMRYANDPIKSSIFIGRAIIDSPSFVDDGVRAQGETVAPRVQTMSVEKEAIFITTFNAYSCSNYPSALLMLSRDLQRLLHLTKFDNVGTFNPLEETRYPVDMVVMEKHVMVAFSHHVRSIVALYNRTNLKMVNYVFFEKEMMEEIIDDGGGGSSQSPQQQPEQEYVKLFTKLVRIDERRAWAFTSNGKIVAFDPSTAFTSPRRNATYSLHNFEEGMLTSVELVGDTVYAMVGARLFLIDQETVEIRHFNERCGMRAKEFDGTWGLTGPFLMHPYSGFGYLFPSGSMQHVALRSMDISSGDGVDIGAAYASQMWRYHYANVDHVNHANMSTIAVRDNILVAGTSMANHDFQPPLLLVSHLKGCAAGRAGAGCIACRPGYFASHDGMEACDACGSGKYSRVGEAVECLECPHGYFYDSMNGTQCYACDFGTYADREGSTRCELCPIDTFHMQSASVSVHDCMQCARGHITRFAGSPSCEPCELGKFKSGRGRCSKCAPGRHRSQLADIECSSCEEGKFAGGNGTIACQSCPAGYHTEEFARTSCLACAKGRFSISGHGGPHEACEACSAGYFNIHRGSPDVSFCAPCPPGTEFASLEDAASSPGVCRDCASGFYGDGSDRPCQPCEDGEILLGSGANSSAQCLQCPRGYFWTSISQPCRACPANTYQPDEGKVGEAACVACPAGTLARHLANVDGGDCVPCESGKYARPASMRCLPCIRGKYSNVVGAHDESFCASCAVGFYSGTIGARNASACKACPVGRESRDGREGEVNANSCRICPSGFYGLGEDAPCEECPRGRVLLQEGGTSIQSCRLCPGGYYWTSTKLDCEACPQNTYQPFEGLVGPESCIKCGQGTVARDKANDDADTCEECPLGKFVDGSQCTECVEGRYSDTRRATDASACRECPAGRYGSEAASGSAMGCLPCPAGRVGSKDASRRLFMEESCSLCGSGQISSEGQVECSPCPAGTSPNKDQTVCADCLAGTYADLEGSVHCSKCPANRVASGSKSLLCEPCNTNTQPDEDRTRCVCSVNFFRGANGECVPCPNGASCPDLETTLSTLKVDPGFWRASADSLDIRMCNEARACAGGLLKNSSNDLCREGHTGPLCHVCTPGFAKTKGLCAACPESQILLNVFVTATAPMLAGLILFMLIRTANPRAGQQDMFSGVSKIAASFAQVYSVCSNFNVKWPPIVQSMFSATDYVNPSISFYSAECSIGWSFYQKLWLYLLMPPIYIFLMACILRVLSQKYGGWEFIQRWATTSIVVGLFIAYPSTIKALMRVLSCDRVGTKYYLSTQYEIECYTETHTTYAYLSGLALILYGIGIPLSAFIILYLYRHRLYEPLPQRLRFLFHGYRLYYWEFIVLARKVCILAMSVFLFRRQSVRYQTVVASWAIQGSMFLHLKLHPFDKHTAYGRLCDRLEWMGLIACTATLNTGIVFGTTQDDYELGAAENVILVLVMAVNIFVFTVFSYHLCLSGIKKFCIRAGMLCGLVPRERPSPRTLMRRRKSILGKFVYGTEEQEFEMELATHRSDTRLQIDDSLRDQRLRGSESIEELEKINMTIAEHYKNQTYNSHRYRKVIEKLQSFVVKRKDEDPSVLELYDLFVAEQRKYVDVAEDVFNDLHDDLYDEVIEHSVAQCIEKMVAQCAEQCIGDMVES